MEKIVVVSEPPGEGPPRLSVNARARRTGETQSASVPRGAGRRGALLDRCRGRETHRRHPRRRCVRGSDSSRARSLRHHFRDPPDTGVSDRIKPIPPFPRRPGYERSAFSNAWLTTSGVGAFRYGSIAANASPRRPASPLSGLCEIVLDRFVSTRLSEVAVAAFHHARHRRRWDT